MATMTLQSNERVWDEILDLETSNRSGSGTGSPQRSFTKDDKPSANNDSTALHYSAGLLQRGDTAELPMKESSRPRKKDTKRRNRDGTVGRRSATRESRSERARSLSRGLGRSLSKLRSRSKSALRRTKTTTDKSKRGKSRSRSDVNEQPQSSDPVSIHSVPDRSVHSDDNNINNDDNDSFASDTLDHDRGKELLELFERQREEFQSVMSASVAKFDEEAKYWKEKAKALKKKYEGGTNAKELRVLTSSVSELERKIKDNEKKSGEKIEELENLLKTLGEEKDELEHKFSSSSQQTLVLEQQVKDRDSSIAQLRHVMEKAEEDSESRIELLERQLDKLVEMKSRRPENLSNSQTTSTTASSSMSQTLTAASQASYTSKVSYTSNAHTETSHEDADSDHSSEVKNLEALLVRILAEKDKLAFENENLRALVAQNEPTCKPVALANLCTYQLSCRNCIDQSFVGQTRDNNVKQKVRDHFSEVFYVSRGMDVTVNTDETFMKSSFAQHAAGHCKNLQSSDEVVRWCVKNIKVEKISRKFGRGDTPPPTEKGNNFEF
ncbi:hypothetical protein ACHAWT_000866 [Skeletonema menzelii]